MEKTCLVSAVLRSDLVCWEDFNAATMESKAAQPATRCGASKAATSEAELHSLARDLDMRIMIINCAALASSSKRFISRKHMLRELCVRTARLVRSLWREWRALGLGLI